LQAGVAALREYGKLRAGVPASEVIVTLRSQLDGTLGSTIPEEYRGPLFTTLAEAQRLAGDLESARANWERAAKYGDAQAILALANQALELPTRAAEGVRKLRQAAAAGSSEALTRLADVEQREGGDARRALLLIGQAAQAGYAPALTTLGQRYESGDGLPRDTQQAAELYRVALGPGGAPTGDVETIPLTGDWQQVAGFNANGIAATPDGQTLLVINSTTGILYAVDAATGEATAVDAGGALLTQGDGILLRGTTLWVVRNRSNEIVELQMAPDWQSATPVATITDPDFDVPTTVALQGSRLYAVNARFTTPPTPDTEYDVVLVDGR